MKVLFQNDIVSFANKDDVLTYLIHLGYLAYQRKSNSAFVPNEEIYKVAVYTVTLFNLIKPF